MKEKSPLGTKNSAGGFGQRRKPGESLVSKVPIRARGIGRWPFVKKRLRNGDEGGDA